MCGKPPRRGRSSHRAIRHGQRMQSRCGLSCPLSSAVGGEGGRLLPTCPTGEFVKSQAPQPVLRTPHSVSQDPAPKGRSAIARGVSPWFRSVVPGFSPEGAVVSGAAFGFCRPFSAPSLFAPSIQGLAPRAIDDHPFGAENPGLARRRAVWRSARHLTGGLSRVLLRERERYNKAGVG